MDGVRFVLDGLSEMPGGKWKMFVRSEVPSRYDFEAVARECAKAFVTFANRRGIDPQRIQEHYILVNAPRHSMIWHRPSPRSRFRLIEEIITE